MRANAQWCTVTALTSLDTLFDMLQEQSDQRQRQVQCALHACTDKSLLHGQGGSAHQADAQEDVAAFAALSR
jgi:hypothetical protein